MAQSIHTAYNPLVSLSIIQETVKKKQQQTTLEQEAPVQREATLKDSQLVQLLANKAVAPKDSIHVENSSIAIDATSTPAERPIPPNFNPDVGYDKDNPAFSLFTKEEWEEMMNASYEAGDGKTSPYPSGAVGRFSVEQYGAELARTLITEIKEGLIKEGKDPSAIDIAKIVKETAAKIANAGDAFSAAEAAAKEYLATH